MEFVMKCLKDPPVLIIITTFWSGMIYTMSKYFWVAKNLNKLVADLESFTKSNLTYRFEEFKQLLLNNPCTKHAYENFQDALIFSDTIAFQDSEDNIEYENVSESISGIQSSTDIPYYFNEESMVYPFYNKGLVATLPELLTGFGPLFTFLKIATAFGLLDFSSPENLTHSVSEFVGDMQIAAICSVLAVGSCLTFTITDRLVTAAVVMNACHKLQGKLASLFSVVTTESFMIDMLKTSKIQNHENGSILKTIPKSFATTIQKDLANVIMPYLDSLIFGVNTLNDTMSKKGGDGDELGGLF